MRTLMTTLCLGMLLTTSAHAAKTKTTVDQLNALIDEMYQGHKSDDEIASRLKEVDLSEQLTTAAANSLTKYHPGPAVIRSILLLSVESALLPPPAADLPTLPAPDAAAQAALVSKAKQIADQSFPQVPRLTATKQTLRFQNGIASVQNLSGSGNRMGNANGFQDNIEYLYPALVSAQSTEISSLAGEELPPAVVKQRDPASPLGQVSQIVPGLPLTTVLSDLGNTTPTFLRWQTINSRQTAVFTFSVDRKQSHYKINYCCFPEFEHVGSEMGFAANSGSVATFKPFNASPGYQGELYIDSTTGIVLRLVTRAATKPKDFVTQEDIRVDYTPVEVGSTHYILPVHSAILTTVVPNGDSFMKYSTRRTLFDVTYSNYHPAASASHP
ncbi:MAG: hypothetical protein KGK08_12545 [Acidobacteriota bacterium]|nr:hypothetical protein [Acidobacteriota bacterium]